MSETVVPVNTTKALISNLEYIADSPAREYGGFHPQVVETAQAALRFIKTGTAAYCKTCEDTGWNHHAQGKPSKRWPTGWKTIRCGCKAGKLKVSA